MNMSIEARSLNPLWLFNDCVLNSTSARLCANRENYPMCGGFTLFFFSTQSLSAVVSSKLKSVIHLSPVVGLASMKSWLPCEEASLLEIPVKMMMSSSIASCCRTVD